MPSVLVHNLEQILIAVDQLIHITLSSITMPTKKHYAAIEEERRMMARNKVKLRED